jgi:predicted NAD-dependent protein-ADP-ribosyltransferase YbiA (DUF1768 family)
MTDDNYISLNNKYIKIVGKLSNNFNYNMVINNETWNNVSQYIYTNMITNYVYRQDMKSSTTNHLYNNYIKYKNITEEDIISNSLQEALEVKFKNKEMIDILLSTEDKDIEYLSNNKLLGTGNDKTGLNLLGKYLMQIRNNLEKEKNLSDEKNKFYEAFVVYNLMEKEIKQDDNDLSVYLNNPNPFEDKNDNNFSNIINIYLKKYPGYYDQMINNEKTKDNFFKDISKDSELKKILEYSINNPSVIVLYLRKKYLRNLKLKKNFVIKNKIFNMYLEYILENNFSDSNIGKLNKEDIEKKEEELNIKRDQFIIDYENLYKLKKDIEKQEENIDPNEIDIDDDTLEIKKENVILMSKNIKEKEKEIEDLKEEIKNQKINYSYIIDKEFESINGIEYN